jgi:hypothetical protein
MYAPAGSGKPFDCLGYGNTALEPSEATEIAVTLEGLDISMPMTWRLVMPAAASIGSNAVT